ncbi:unnamed protein product [Discosporangium mesarthrocarpum]
MRIILATMASSSLPFYVDPAITSIREGQRPKTAGLVLVAGWHWGERPELKAVYESLYEKTTALDPACYAYPPQHLHCTIATLSSFKNEESPYYHAPEDDKSLVRQVWGEALSRAFERRMTLRPFEVGHSSAEPGLRHWHSGCSSALPILHFAVYRNMHKGSLSATFHPHFPPK